MEVSSPQPRDGVLIASFAQEARLDEEFIVLTVAASLIATLGLMANSAAVVIGAMLIAPWILPLRAIGFGILQGRLSLVITALSTLATGVGLTVGLSVLMGLLVGLPIFGSEVAARTSPNLLDLGVALVAGAMATYAKVRSKAVSSLAGTAIAVALVPPVCVLGLLLATRQWQEAWGAGLLFAANLLGILSGGLLMLAATEPRLRVRLWRSRLGLVSLGLTALLLVPLTSSFLSLMAQARRATALQQVERSIARSLRSRTLTLGKDSELTGITIDWEQNPPLIRATVRGSNPRWPTSKQVAAVQTFINAEQPIRFRLLVQRTAIDVIGPETAPNPPELQVQAPEQLQRQLGNLQSNLPDSTAPADGSGLPHRPTDRQADQNGHGLPPPVAPAPPPLR